MSEYKEAIWKFIVHFFTTDRTRKAISLLLAIAIYLTISRFTGEEKVFTGVPVEIKLPESLVYLGQKKLEFNSVTIRGGEKPLNRLSPEDIKVVAEINAANYKKDAPYTITFTTRDLKSPFGTTIVAIDPHTFYLPLESRISKSVPIEAEFSGVEQIDENYRISHTSFSPTHVTVSGAESLVKSIDKVQTEPIPVHGNAESFEYQATIMSRSNIDISPKQVVCFVDIIKENEDKTIEAVPLSMLIAPELEGKFIIEPLSAAGVAITLHGPKGKLALFQEQTLRAYADLTALNAAGTYTVEVQCNEPNDPELRVTTIYPKQVQVKLTLKNNNKQ